MRLSVLIVAAILFPSLIWAADSEDKCSSVDLSSKFGPVRNQGSAGFCYSFAAADVLSEALQIRPPKMVSPMYLAAQYISMSSSEAQSAVQNIIFEHDPDTISQVGYYGANPRSIINYNPSGKPLLKREGGYPNLIMAHALALPKICSETDVPSEGEEPSQNVDRNEFFLVRMGELADGYNINAYFNARKSNLPLPDCLNDSPLKKMIGSIEELKPAIQDYAAGVIRDETAAKCTQSMPSHSKLKVHSVTFIPVPKMNLNIGPGMGMIADPNQLKKIQDSNQKMREQNSIKISNILQNQRPIAISYNACVLVTCKGDEYKAHASVVIAQRWNSQLKRCEAKIRNSWGNHCENKRTDVECSDGNWWVSREDLASNSDSASWIESQ
jgi:hypothetical protein